MKLKEESQIMTLLKNSLTANANGNPLFYIGTRQDQIITAKLGMWCSNLNGHLYSFMLLLSVLSTFSFLSLSFPCINIFKHTN